MDAQKFDELVQLSFESLPEVFRKACEGVVMRSQDFADQEILQALNVDNPYHLLGLYHGVNIANKSVDDLPAAPDMVFIYRKPILSYAQEHNISLEEVVLHVVVHEIGHHMGFSDEDMEEIEFGRGGFYHKN